MISALDYKKIDLNVLDGTYGQTPLMYACRRGNVQATLRLLELGANPNSQSAKGRTALFEAILRIKDNMSSKELEKSTEIIKNLLELASPGNEVDVNIPNPKLSNRTALMMAIYRGHTEMALPLLRHPKIEINQQDAGGYTALSLAAFVGTTDVVRELVEFDEILVDKSEYSASRTALMFAAEGNHCEIVEMLLRRGAKPNLKNSNGATAILRAVEEGSVDVVRVMIDPQWEVNLFSLDEDNRTLMHGAAEYGQTEILQILHEKGLQVNARDSIGMTPFHVACKCGRLDTAHYLLEIGADSSINDTHGRTPFIVAYQYGQDELMELCKNEGTNRVADAQQNLRLDDLPVWSLVVQQRMELLTKAISRGAALDVKEPGTKKSPLHCAVLENGNDSKADASRLNILRELLIVGKMSPNDPDKYGQTALHIACLGGFGEAAVILLGHNAKLEAVDRFGRTPLMIASKLENFDIALALIDAGAKVDESKVDIDKLLLAAIGLRNTKAMEKLLRAKADRLAQDDYGRTTDLIAREVGSVDLLKILQGTRSFVFPTPKTDVKTSIGVVEMEVFDEEHARQAFLPFRSPALD
jgi:ankyrin repeat protein